MVFAPQRLVAEDVGHRHLAGSEPMSRDDAFSFPSVCGERTLKRPPGERPQRWFPAITCRGGGRITEAARDPRKSGPKEQAWRIQSTPQAVTAVGQRVDGTFPARCKFDARKGAGAPPARQSLCVLSNNHMWPSHNKSPRRKLVQIDTSESDHTRQRRVRRHETAVVVRRNADIRRRRTSQPHEAKTTHPYLCKFDITPPRRAHEGQLPPAGTSRKSPRNRERFPPATPQTNHWMNAVICF